ncbi:MAG: aminotransferase class IV [Firmicutes bacterium]|nr:aminotransferase class IV [Bacillota bacterium]
METVWHWAEGTWRPGSGMLDSGDSLWRRGLALVETVRTGPEGAPLWSWHRERLAGGLARLGWPAALPEGLPEVAAPAALRLVASWSPERPAVTLRAHLRPLPAPPPWPALAYPPLAACPPPAPLHGLKTLSHSLAAGEDPAPWYDRVLANPRGEVMETLRHNLFWTDREGRVFTPSLETGCVAGVGRRWALARLRAWSIAVAEVATAPPDPEDIAECWLTNALSGPVPVGALGHHPLDPGRARLGPALAGGWPPAQR